MLTVTSISEVMLDSELISKFKLPFGDNSHLIAFSSIFLLYSNEPLVAQLLNECVGTELGY